MTPIPEADPLAWAGAGGEVVYWWHRYTNAKDPLSQARALTELANHMSDLKSWLPDYDPETQTVEWEREDVEDNGILEKREGNATT